MALGTTPPSKSRQEEPPLLTKRHKSKCALTTRVGSALHDWTIEALKAVARRPRYGLPRIYQLGGLLSRVCAAAPGAAARIEALNEDSLRLMISEVCNFDEIRLNQRDMDTHRIVPPPREILAVNLGDGRARRSAAFRR